MENIKLELTRNEALVLFDLVNRLNEKEQNSFFEDQSEQRVLWNLECTLERCLSELFAENYSEILEKSRKQVRDI